MPKWLRALIAGYGAKKLGGGCLSTILIFILIYWALGQCNTGTVRQGNIKSEQHKAVSTGQSVVVSRESSVVSGEK